MKEKETAKDRYRKKLKAMKVDLKIEERQMLDKLVHKKNITIAKWVRDHLYNDYNNL